MSEKIVLENLSPKEYEHPLDRKAINTLEAIPGVRKVVEKIWEKFLQKFLVIEYMGSSLKITSDNYPEIYNLLDEACLILNVKEIPPLYLVNDPNMQAYAIGASKPFIGITYALIERLEPAELLFVIAHELGHIKSGHVLYYNIATYFKPIVEVASQLSLGLAGLAGGGFQIALNYGQRMSEFTSDRAGLLVCQDPKVCIRAMIKIAGLPVDRVGIDAFEKTFLEQAEEFRDFDYGAMNKFVKIMSTYDNSHPWTVLRASEFLKWESSEEYQRILKRESIIEESISMPQKLLCPQCDAEISENFKFCKNCGFNLQNLN